MGQWIGGEWVCSRIDVTTPKLPPPPRSAQQQVGVVAASQAVTVSPAAVTTVAPTSRSQVSPYRRATTPMPPPSARPESPTVGQEPAGIAAPCAASQS